MMEGLHQAVARDLFFSRRRHFAEEEDDDEDDEGQGRRRRRKASFLFSSFFKACCLLAPLKVVGCMYTACVCAICIATARFQLAESTDVVLPAFLSLSSFLGLLVCRTKLLLSPSVFISNGGCTDTSDTTGCRGRRREDFPSFFFSSSSRFFRFFSPAPSFLLFLFLSGILQLASLGFLLYPHLRRECLRISSEESPGSSTSLLLSLLVFHALTTCLHLYRHVSRCRHVLLLSSRNPSPPPVLLPVFLASTLTELLFSLFVSIPLSFAILLPLVPFLHCFSSSFSSSRGGGGGGGGGSARFLEEESFFPSFSSLVLVGPLTAFFRCFSFPSLSDCHVWISSFLLSVFLHFLLLFLLNVHAELQQQADPSESLAVAASLAQLATVSTDMTTMSKETTRDTRLLQFAPPREEGRRFDDQHLLLRWLHDCAVALEAFLSSPPDALGLARGARDGERKKLAVFGSSSSSSTVSRKETSSGRTAASPPRGGPRDFLDFCERTDTLTWVKCLDSGASLGVQRERCPLVPALQEFFSETRLDDFPLTPGEGPEFETTLQKRKKERGFFESPRAQKHAGPDEAKEEEDYDFDYTEVSRRDVAKAIGEAMIERRLGGGGRSPSFFSLLYEDLVLEACTHYARVLQTLQHSQLLLSPDRTVRRAPGGKLQEGSFSSASLSSSFSSSSFLGEQCREASREKEEFFYGSSPSSSSSSENRLEYPRRTRDEASRSEQQQQHEGAAPAQPAFSASPLPSSSSSSPPQRLDTPRHRQREGEEEEEKKKIKQAKCRVSDAVAKSRKRGRSSLHVGESVGRLFSVFLLSFLQSLYQVFVSLVCFLCNLDRFHEEKVLFLPEGEGRGEEPSEHRFGSLQEKRATGRESSFFWESTKKRRATFHYEAEQREACVMSALCACAVEGYGLWICIRAKVEEDEREESEKQIQAGEAIPGSTISSRKKDIFYNKNIGDLSYPVMETRRFPSLQSSAEKLTVKILEVLQEQDRLRRLCECGGYNRFSSRDRAAGEKAESGRELWSSVLDCGDRQWIGRSSCPLRYEIFEYLRDFHSRAEQTLLLMRNFRGLRLESLVSSGSSGLISCGVCTALSPVLRSQLRRILQHPSET